MDFAATQETYCRALSPNGLKTETSSLSSNPDMLGGESLSRHEGNLCHKQPGRVARTKEFFQYRPVPTLALLDHDTKHFSTDVKECVEALGGFTSAIESVCPELATAGTILRASTSSGISNADARIPPGGPIPGGCGGPSDRHRNTRW
jgi:hypothetical protein